MLCPSCRHDLGTPDPHWAPWCPSCEWGVDPTPADDYGSALDRWWRRRLNALSAKEHERLLAHGLASGPSVDARLVLAVAAVVHLVTLLLTVAVVLLLLSPVWIGFKIGLGLMGFGLVYLLLPLPTRGEEVGKVLSRTEAPQLWSLVDEAAAAARTPSPDRIELVSWVNAAYGRVGWRRRRVLYLGYPLWAALSRQGRVSLLGHELGHEAHRDVTRRLFVGGAVGALREWRGLIATPRLALGDEGIAGLAVTVARIALAVVSAPFLVLLLGLEVVLDTLASRAHQYAEHRCDELGAVLAGKQGALEAEQVLLGAEALSFAVDVRLRADAQADVWEAVEQHVAAVPESERRRQVLRARKTLQSVDDEHPPSYRRIELLESRPDSTASVVLDASRDAAVAAELRAHEPWVRRRLRDALVSA